MPVDNSVQNIENIHVSNININESRGGIAEQQKVKIVNNKQVKNWGSREERLKKRNKEMA